MRFYEITIYDPATGDPISSDITRRLRTNSTYTSYYRGNTLPAALNIELDVVSFSYNTPFEGSFLRVWGVSLKELRDAAKLNYARVVITAGMKPGLPIATAASKDNQAGIIVEGSIQNAYGNWQGTTQTLDMTLIPYTGPPPVGTQGGAKNPASPGQVSSVNPTAGQPGNIQLQWKDGESLEGPLDTTLKAAFPRMKTKIFISPLLIARGDQVGNYMSLGQLASAVNDITKGYSSIQPLTGGAYQGVYIFARGENIIAFDNTIAYGSYSKDTPKKIRFQDMVGQPTWLGPAVLSFKTMMRGDLQINDFVSLPPGIQSPYTLVSGTGAAPNSGSKDTSGFANVVFQISRMHHFGNYRNPEGNAWVTVFEALAVPLVVGGAPAGTVQVGQPVLAQ